MLAFVLVSCPCPPGALLGFSANITFPPAWSQKCSDLVTSCRFSGSLFNLAPGSNPSLHRCISNPHWVRCGDRPKAWPVLLRQQTRNLRRKRLRIFFFTNQNKISMKSYPPGLKKSAKVREQYLARNVPKMKPIPSLIPLPSGLILRRFLAVHHIAELLRTRLAVRK